MKRKDIKRAFGRRNRTAAPSVRRLCVNHLADKKTQACR